MYIFGMLTDYFTWLQNGFMTTLRAEYANSRGDGGTKAKLYGLSRFQLVSSQSRESEIDDICQEINKIAKCQNIDFRNVIAILNIQVKWFAKT